MRIFKTNPSGLIDAANIVYDLKNHSSIILCMRLLRSSSDLSKCHLISSFERTQKDLINTIIRVNNKSLAMYDISQTMERVHAILNRMKQDAQRYADDYVRANMVAGRISSRIHTKTDKSAFDQSDIDLKTQKALVDKLLGNIYHAIACTEQSIRTQLNAACVRAQMTKQYAEQLDENISLPSISSYIDTELVPKKSSGGGLSRAIMKALNEDPESATKDIESSVFGQIKSMHDKYLIGKREAERVYQNVSRSVSKDNGMANAQRWLIDDVMRNGITAFVDKGGKRWSMGSYCNMSVQSMQRQSDNAGGLLDDPEHDLYIVVKNNSGCPICSRYEGKIYSRSGTDKRFPPLSSIFGKINENGSDDLSNTYLSIHPNCKHVIKKWYGNPDKHLTQTEETVDKRTKEQIRIYKEHERLKAKEVASEKCYREMMPYIPPKELGTWLSFHKHFMENDEKYRELQRKYNEAKKNK